MTGDTTKQPSCQTLSHHLQRTKTHRGTSLGAQRADEYSANKLYGCSKSHEPTRTIFCTEFKVNRHMAAWSTARIPTNHNPSSRSFPRNTSAASLARSYHKLLTHIIPYSRRQNDAGTVHTSGKQRPGLLTWEKHCMAAQTRTHTSKVIQTGNMFRQLNGRPRTQITARGTFGKSCDCSENGRGYQHMGRQ